MGRPGIKTLKAVYAGYTLKDLASDNPSITVSYLTSPEATSYTDLGSLAESEVYTRRRIPIGGRVWGAAFKFTRVASGDFYGYDLAAEVNFHEESKRID